jgi:hypothetical protein
MVAGLEIVIDYVGEKMKKQLENGGQEQTAFSKALERGAERLTKTMRESGFTVTEGIPPTQTATPTFKATFHTQRTLNSDEED